MRVERKIALTKKELEAIKIIFEMFEKNEDDLFDSANDFMGFIDDVARYNSFQNYIIVEEN